MMKEMGARVCLCVFRRVGEIEGYRDREKGSRSRGRQRCQREDEEEKGADLN